MAEFQVRGIGGFWDRQHSAERTRSQVFFDVTFGIVMPLLCLVFDPVVFRSRFLFSPAPHPFAGAAYVFIGFQMAVLAAWLLLQPRLRRAAAFFAGPLLAGATFSLLLAVLISPLSVIGVLFFGLGLLGFTPFLTAFVFWRNAVRALGQSSTTFKPAVRVCLIAAGMLMTAAPPFAATQAASRAIERVVARPSSAGAVNHARRLGWVLPLDPDPLALSYGRENDVRRKALLAKAYHEITGGDVESRLERLRD